VRGNRREELKIPLSQSRSGSSIPLGTKDTGVGGSRATRVYGNAGYEAALKAVAAIKQAAVEQMGVAPDQITLAKGAALHPRVERRLTYGEIVKAKGSPITAEGTFNNTSKIHAASMCVQVAEVEVDPQTGQVELKKFTSTHNTGTVLNPLMHQGQIEGGSMTGIGYALMEQLIIADGKVATTNFGEYKIPTIRTSRRLGVRSASSPRAPAPTTACLSAKLPISPRPRPSPTRWRTPAA
jgi:CO/xanthine dehydrogenase Mo-binding subunit